MSRSLGFGTKRALLAAAVLVALTQPRAAHAATPLTFSMAFDQSSIGPGSTATATFTITNPDAVDPAANVAFSATLPANVTIATPSNRATTCTDSVLTAVDGGTSIDLSGGRLGTLQTCLVTVDVTSSVIGSHVHLTGDLTSSSGNSGTASATLMIDGARPGFSLSFVPATIPLHGTVAIVFTIDNTANAGNEGSVGFSTTLGTGLKVAPSPLVSNTCLGGFITAAPGSTSVSVSNLTVLASASCTVSIEVVAGTGGSITTTTSQLAWASGFAGKASAVLPVAVSPLNLAAFFKERLAAPGGTATLQITIDNFHPNTATAISFTNDLSATLAGLTAISLPSDPCGAGSTITGTSTVTLSNGTLASGAQCTFDVTVQIPAGASAGTYTNTTSAITATVNASGVTGNTASDTIDVGAAPSLTMSFTDDPVAAGGTVTAEFTITNTSTTEGATDLAFTVNLDEIMPGITATVLPTAGFCGGGASMTAGTFLPPFGQSYGLDISGGSLAASASCTFQVTLQLAPDSSNGQFMGTTSEITGMVGAAAVVGAAATDTLTVVTAPRLALSFTDDPVAPGGTVTLQVSLSYDENAPADGTNLGFTIDLDAALTGLAATGLPVSNICGAGSQVSGTSTLSLTGATLSANTSCTFNVIVQVPLSATAGQHTVTSSTVAGTSLGVAVTSQLASEVLQVQGFTAQKSFTNDPAVAGAMVTLEYVLTNTDPSQAISAIGFTDDLDAALSGLVATGLPMNDVCGTGSQLSGTSVLTLTGGNLAIGASCTITVTLQVPAAATTGEYPSTTSSITATIGATGVTVAGVSDTLLIGDPLMLAATFTNDPVAVGGTVTLEFTLANADPTQAATALTFSDDLGAALTGLAATGLPMTDVCGVGSQIAGTDVVTLTGGTLAAGTSCTFSITVQVPSTVLMGTTVTNTTSSLTGMVGGTARTAGAASDDLVLDFATLTKTFGGSVMPGQTTTLSFTLQNRTVQSISGLAFQDDLDAVLSGLGATDLPMSDVCGAGSSLTGTSTVQLTGATLAAAASCTFAVTVLVPTTAAAGDYDNVTTDSTGSGLRAGGPARATLTVIIMAPAFSKAFAPGSITIDGTSTLTLTIDNSASTVAATTLAFTDNLPAGMVIAATPNASTDCTGGTLVADASASSITYSGGTVAASATCTVTVDVTSNTAGTLVNTTDELTSSSGSSGTASATLVVNEAPGLDAGGTVDAGGGTDAGGDSDGGGGCCDSGRPGSGTGLLVLMVIGLLLRRRRGGFAG